MGKVSISNSVHCSAGVVPIDADCHGDRKLSQEGRQKKKREAKKKPKYILRNLEQKAQLKFQIDELSQEGQFDLYKTSPCRVNIKQGSGWRSENIL